MTQPSPHDPTPGTRPGRGTPDTWAVVGSFGSYPDAERAVDILSDNGFPVERVVVVGRGLNSYEQVTGRLTSWRAAGQGMLSGLVVGALFGWLFGILDWVSPLVSGLFLALYGAVLGAIVGAIVGFAGHSVTGGRRDFSSVTSLRADRYDVMVDPPLAEQAEDLLGLARR